MKAQGALYCAFSKSPPQTKRAKDWLRALLPGTFPRYDQGWWFDIRVGVALYAPQVTTDSAHGASAVAASSGPGMKELCAVLLRRGISVLLEVTGPFALIAWDGVRNELMLARDKFGQRTLYVREMPDHFLCSSELSPLLRAHQRCALDTESAIRYLFLGQPLNGRTLAAEIKKVSAAHCLHWRSGGVLISRRYYSPLRHDRPRLPNRAQRREIQNALDSVISEGPAGQCQALLLSGGVDSSYLAATVASQESGSVEGFTIAFEGLPEANETEYAAFVAKKFSLRHHVITLTVSDAVRHLNAILESAEPCSAWATLGHRHLVEAVASRHTHLLSGLGADEVFGGYGAYLRSYARFCLHKAAWPLTGPAHNLCGILSNPSDMLRLLFSGVPRFFDIQDLRRALHPPFNRWNALLPDMAFYREVQAMKPSCHYFEMMIAHECQHRIPELLFCGFEQVANEYGVTTAYPFLSSEVVERVIALRASLRFRLHGTRWKNKILLRQFALGRVPARILNRSPVSYNIPILPLLGSRPFAVAVLERLHGSAFLDLGIVRKEWLDNLQKRVLQSICGSRTGYPSAVNQIWALLTLSSWYQRWLQGG
jgi:asparagine synthase (glutamine-hydrolysing)